MDLIPLYSNNNLLLLTGKYNTHRSLLYNDDQMSIHYLNTVMSIKQQPKLVDSSVPSFFFFWFTIFCIYLFGTRGAKQLHLHLSPVNVAYKLITIDCCNYAGEIKYTEKSFILDVTLCDIIASFFIYLLFSLRFFDVCILRILLVFFFENSTNFMVWKYWIFIVFAIRILDTVTTNKLWLLFLNIWWFWRILTQPHMC